MSSQTRFRYPQTIDGLNTVLANVAALRDIGRRAQFAKPWSDEQEEKVEQLRSFAGLVISGDPKGKLGATIGFAANLEKDLEKTLDKEFTASVSRFKSTAELIEKMNSALFVMNRDRINEVIADLESAVNNEENLLDDLLRPYVMAQSVIAPLYGTAVRERADTAKREVTARQFERERGSREKTKQLLATL